MEKISKRLNQALKVRNMRPIELSEKAKISKGAISSYLSGKYLPKSKYVYKIAKVLNVNPVWLLGYDVEMEFGSIDILPTDKIILWDKLFGYEKGDEIPVVDFCFLISIYHDILVDQTKLINNITNAFLNSSILDTIDNKNKETLCDIFDNFKKMEILMNEVDESAKKSKSQDLIIVQKNIQILQLVQENKIKLDANYKSSTINYDKYNRELSNLKKILSKSINEVTYQIFNVKFDFDDYTNNQNKGDKDNEEM